MTNLELSSSVRLIVAIALGIAFGVALIPVATKAVAFVASAGRTARDRTRSRGVRVIALLLLLIAGAVVVYSWYRRRNAVPIAPMESAAIVQKFSTDSSAACSDSALVAQRNEEEAASAQLLADMVEPDRSRGDSAWLAWKHRKDEREKPSSFVDWIVPRTCDEYRRAPRNIR